MPPTITYIVDTSYLTELFFIPGKSSEAGHDAVIEKFTDAINQESRIVVPFPVVFELGNHIAHITDGAFRQQKAQKLISTVTESRNNQAPWLITGVCDQETLLNFESFFAICDEFCQQYAAQQIGIVDSIVIREAQRFKSRYPAFFPEGYLVHIWTRDNRLKAYEPDVEANFFV